MIKALKVAHEYSRRDAENNLIAIERALDGIDFEINQGDFISIIGPNGSGKSTLAKHLNALLQPTEGTIWVDGMDTNDEEYILSIRQTAGMVFQNPDNQIIANIVEDDVAFGPENIGIPTKEIEKRVTESLGMVGMLKRRKSSPNHLSGGQKQRVAIAGILAMKPKCIILDEPTAMLDPAGRKEVIEAITKLNKEENITIILITHNMEEVISSDKIYVINDGKIAMSGTPEQIFEREDELVRCNLEIPRVMHIANILRKNGIDVSEGVINADELVEMIERMFG